MKPLLFFNSTNSAVTVYFPLLIILVLFLSCDKLVDDDDNSPGLLEQESPLMIDRFPERSQTGVDTGITVWIQLLEASGIKNLSCEITQYPYSDSAWYTQEGIEFLKGPKDILSFGSEAEQGYDNLYVNPFYEGNKVFFPVTGRYSSGIYSNSIIAGFNYLVHVYGDNDKLDIYWTFSTKSSDNFLENIITKEFAANNDVYVKLVNFNEGFTSELKYWAITQFSCESDTTIFKINNIDTGKYTAWLFIDRDKNASGDVNAFPSRFDLVTQIPELRIVNGKNMLMVSDSGWTGYGSAPNLSGIIINDLAKGKIVYIKLVSAGAGYEAEAEYWTKADIDCGYVYYNIPQITYHEYTLWVFIDINNNAAGNENSLPDPGDYYFTRNSVISGDDTKVVIDIDEWLVFE